MRDDPALLMIRDARVVPVFVPQRLLPDVSRQSRHGVSDVLYLAWLLVMAVAGVASVPGVSRSSFDARVVERFAQIVGCGCTQTEVSRRRTRRK